MNLGRLGVWANLDSLSAADAAAFATRVEGMGYSALWMPEARGRNVLVTAALVLAATRKLIVASGIANIYARDAVSMAAGQKTLAEASGGRFLLGLGVSHIPMVEGLRGHKYDKPLGTMSAYLDAIYKDAPADSPVVVAALGPKMLALSGAKSMGAVPYNVTPRHTAEAAKILGKNKILAVEQKVTIETDPAKARALGRKELARYLLLPNYCNNWLRIGFTEADLADGGSDKFIDAMCLWGDADTERVT